VSFKEMVVCDTCGVTAFTSDVADNVDSGWRDERPWVHDSHLCPACARHVEAAIQRAKDERRAVAASDGKVG
jgi:hypothetical protein